MKSFSSVFYVFLFFFSFHSIQAMNFNTNLLPKNMGKLPQMLDEKNIIDEKIVSPALIFICGEAIALKDKKLKDVYTEIQHLDESDDTDSFFEYSKFIDLVAPAHTTPDNYVQAINHAILLSATTAWAPDVYVGKTPQQIIDYMKLAQSAMYKDDKMFSLNLDVARIMPQMIQDQVKNLRALDIKPVADNASKKIVIIAPSQQAHEWTFVFKDTYENGALATASPLSTQGTLIGQQAKTILDTAIAHQKSYVEYLEVLVAAVKQADIKTSDSQVVMPLEIVVNKESVSIVGKNSKQLYDLVMTEQGDTTSLIKNLERNLQPEQVKQDFMTLCAENDYCITQKNKIQEAIALFNGSFDAKKAMKRPESFGDAWLVKANEYKGTSVDIVIDPLSAQWANLVVELQNCLQPKVVSTGVYRLVPLTNKYPHVTQTLYRQEQVILAAKAVYDKAISIVESMKFKMDGTKKIMLNLYPAPMSAFQAAFNAVYFFDEKEGYKVVINKELKDLQDPENVEIMRAALLQLFAGIDFGVIKKDLSAIHEQVQEDGKNIPASIINAMKDYIAQEKIQVTATSMLKVFNATKNSFVDGWRAVGPAGIQSPSGGMIGMDDVVKLMKLEDIAQQSTQGAVNESEYVKLHKHIKGTQAEDDDSILFIALRSGKTYKEYLEMLANGNTVTPEVGITKDVYNQLLQQVVAQISGKALTNMKKNGIKLGIINTAAYKDLNFDQDYTNKLFESLFAGDSFEKFTGQEQEEPVKKKLKIDDTSIFNDCKKSIVASNILLIKAICNQD